MQLRQRERQRPNRISRQPVSNTMMSLSIQRQRQRTLLIFQRPTLFYSR